MGLRDDVEEGHLADGGGHLRVFSGCGERVAASHRRAERRDPRAIDLWQRTHKRNRRLPVFELSPGIEEIRLTTAIAEAAMVEDKRRKSSIGEALRKGTQAVPSRAGEPVGNDYRWDAAGPSNRRIQPCRAGVTAN